MISRNLSIWIVLVKWSSIIFFKEASQKPTVCENYNIWLRSVLKEIVKSFFENDFLWRFLPTYKFRCLLRQIRSIFLDLLVDSSAFHPHTTKLWRARCWNQLSDTSWPGLLSEIQCHRAILLSRDKDVEPPHFDFRRSVNRSRLLYSKGKWWRLLHSDPVFSVESSRPVFLP